MKKLDKAAFLEIAACMEMRGDIVAAYCFGSQAIADRAAPRDLDIALLGRSRYGLGDLLSVHADLSRIIGDDSIDLVDLRAAGPVLKHRVVASGKRFFCADEARANEFEIQALGEYRDSQYRRRVQFRWLRESLVGP